MSDCISLAKLEVYLNRTGCEAGGNA